MYFVNVLELLKILIFSEKMKKYSKKAQQIGGF